MNKVIPIASIILSVLALIISVCGIIFAAVTELLPLLGAFAIVTVVIGFTLSAINIGFCFIFVKSKLCLAAGIISLISLAVNIASFVILIV